MSSPTSNAKQPLEHLLASVSKEVDKARSLIGNLPNEDDYHFFKLFPEFKQPADAAGERIKKLLLGFGSSQEWSDEPEEAGDWLLGIVDDLLEQVDKSLDAEAKGTARTKGTSRAAPKIAAAGASVARHGLGKHLQQVVPFHVSTIRKPQELFLEVVDNSNTPFLPKGPYLSYDGQGDNAVGVDAEDWNVLLRGRVDSHAADVSISGAGLPDVAEKADDQRSFPAGHTVNRPKLTIETNLAGVASRSPSPGLLSQGIPPSPASPSRGLLALDKHAKRLGVGSAKQERQHPLRKTLRGLAYPPWLFQAPPDPLLEPEAIDARQIGLVDTLPGLKEVAAKLAKEREVAVDLEAHQFRSFQGFVCLMQLSTRKEDFVVDTIALREHIGPTLGPVFADSSILKVLHGADRDILWLQRDFGIYVVNLFDTGQAARQLSLASFGLGHLLEHFCGVHSDKRYQLADWRLRPLPEEMFKYARMDTHFLLYIFDRLRSLLLDQGAKVMRMRKNGEGGESSDGPDSPRSDPIRQVLDRSRDLCLAVYEKELFRETSYLKVYKNHGRHLNKQQLAALAGLYAWRDRIAREQDESCGYILPKHLLLRLAEEVPADVRKLHSIVRGQSPVLTERAADVIEVLRAAREQASGTGGAAFDPALWQGADVIPDYVTSEDEASSEALEALARDGGGLDGDAESAGGEAVSPKEGHLETDLFGGVAQKRGIGQSALGDPSKSAVGPSVDDDSESEPGEAGTAAVAPPGTGVVVKRAAKSALFGRAAKKADGRMRNGKNGAEAARVGDVRFESSAPIASLPGPSESSAPIARVENVRNADGSEGVDDGVVRESGGATADPAARELVLDGAHATGGSMRDAQVGAAEPGPGRKKRRVGLGSMFGSRRPRGESEDRGAKVAAERIKASLALPFTPVAETGLQSGVEETPGGAALAVEPRGGDKAAGEQVEAEGAEGSASLEDVMMLDVDGAEEEGSGSGREETTGEPDPEAEKRVLFGTPDLPTPISQAYRKRDAADGDGRRETALKKRQGAEGTENGSDEQGKEARVVGIPGAKTGSGGPEKGRTGSAALEVGSEGLGEGGKFDFAAAAGALGLSSFLGSATVTGNRGGGKGKPTKQNRGSKPEEQSYGSQKEDDVGRNFDPFASMDDEDGKGIKAGKRSQAFPRSGNRMSTFRRT